MTRLSCGGCGTELSGAFDSCEFCSLSPEDRKVLRVFLESRGNMKELERHLGVSYPTARGRFDVLLGKLGIERGEAAPIPGKVEVLQALARGEIGIDDALHELD